MAQTYAGPIGVLGITPSFINNTAQQAAATATTTAINQVYQGAGSSFLGSAGQTLVGNLAASTVNVALNAALGTQIAGPGGFSINSGADFLASTITPYVTSTVAAGINEQINNSLQNAGPFAGVLSGVATGLVNQVFGSIGGAIAGGAAGGFGASYKTFPGASADDPDANYGGSAYTLGLNGGDVVFSLQPANQGPQTLGEETTADGATAETTVATDQLPSMPPTAGNPVVDSMKEVSMSPDAVEAGSLYNATAWTTQTGVAPGSRYNAWVWVGGPAKLEIPYRKG